MKKFLKTIAITGLFAAFVLGGCAGNITSNSKDNAGSQEAPDTAQNNIIELTISAAASLKDAMGEIEALYGEKKPEVKLVMNFGGSGTLQQQIEQGAPVDLFISAGKSQVNALLEKDLMIKDSVVDLLGNDLVLVVGYDNKDVNTILDLTKNTVKQIGIGTPESVPAGKYAKEALTNLKLWDTLQPKLVMAKDVTQVLNYVETGNAEAGIVYLSDAQSSTKVKVVETFAADTHSPITYPAGIVSATKQKDAAAAFLEFLQSQQAKDVFTKYGFKTGLTK